MTMPALASVPRPVSPGTGLSNTTIGQITATKTVNLQLMVCYTHKVLLLAGFHSIGFADTDLAIVFASLSTGYAIEHRLVVIKVSIIGRLHRVPALVPASPASRRDEEARSALPSSTG